MGSWLLFHTLFCHQVELASLGYIQSGPSQRNSYLCLLVITIDSSFFKSDKALFSCLLTLFAGSWALSRIPAVALRTSSFVSSARFSMPASMLATIFLYGTFDGAGANFGSFCRTSTSVLVRGREEMFIQSENESSQRTCILVN